MISSNLLPKNVSCEALCHITALIVDYFMESVESKQHDWHHRRAQRVFHPPLFNQIREGSNYEEALGCKGVSLGGLVL